MCGHDGHMAIMIGFAELLFKNQSKIPENKYIRLLFQPAEEGMRGAEVMIKEGALNQIQEIYGLHNFPNGSEGSIQVS